MDIVYTFDENYSSIAATSLISLLENNQDIDELKVHIVDCGISEESKIKFRNICDKYSKNIYFVNGRNFEKKIPVDLNCLNWSFVCYVRLFFSELFPNISKILHIDCDTIVTGKIDEIFNINLDYHYCAACYDCLPSIKYATNFDRNDRYYSNGFVLFNLEKMRENFIQEKFIEYIVEKKGDFAHLDQDVVNHVLKNRIYTLHPKFNLMTYTAVFGEKSCEFFENDIYYTRDEILEAILNPLVIHFVGYNFVSKPWLQPCYHPYNDDWISYFKKTGFDWEILKYTKKKYGIYREVVVYCWNLLYNFRFTNNLLFNYEKWKMKNRLRSYKRKV